MHTIQTVNIMGAHYGSQLTLAHLLSMQNRHNLFIPHVCWIIVPGFQNKRISHQFLSGHSFQPIPSGFCWRPSAVKGLKVAEQVALVRLMGEFLGQVPWGRRGVPGCALKGGLVGGGGHTIARVTQTGWFSCCTWLYLVDSAVFCDFCISWKVEESAPKAVLVAFAI